MDRESAIDQLPTLHSAAIRLQDDGHSNHVIAVAVGIDDDEVPTLLQIAESKLAYLMSTESDVGGRTLLEPRGSTASLPTP
jgi:hypothetical protein